MDIQEEIHKLGLGILSLFGMVAITLVIGLPLAYLISNHSRIVLALIIAYIILAICYRVGEEIYIDFYEEQEA